MSEDELTCPACLQTRDSVEQLLWHYWANHAYMEKIDWQEFKENKMGLYEYHHAVLLGADPCLKP